jgi:uncharacterized membrane protein YfcA
MKQDETKGETIGRAHGTRLASTLKMRRLCGRLIWHYPCNKAGMLYLAAVLAALIGITLGLLGGGGSILTLPMLVYVVKLDSREAIASSLFVVGLTSLVGMVAHAREGRVSFRVGTLFGVAGMAGAYAGGRLAHFVPATLLMLGFASMMLLTSVGMLRGRKAGPSGASGDLALGKAVALGLAVGAISGLVGAGGGFLVVPALSLLGGLPMPRAIATSLMVIAMQSLAGFAGHVVTVTLHWPLLGTVTSACVAGSLVGIRLAKNANPETLRKAFGWLVLGMGVFLLGKQLPPGNLRDVGTPVAVGIVLVSAIFFFARASGRKELPAAAPLTPNRP